MRLGTKLLVSWTLLLTVFHGSVCAQVAPPAEGTPRNPWVAERSPERHALIIGNGAYASSALRNPPGDAALVAKQLQSLDFHVRLGQDLDRQEMQQAIREFVRALLPGDVALLFYAGHGLQVDGVNYMVPLGADIRHEYDVQAEAVRVDEVLGQMAGAETQINIAILDACRDNPYASATRSGRGGLAHMLAPSGTLLAYATAPGQVAADGDGKHSYYSAALAAELSVPGVKIEDVFKAVRARVMQQTAEGQVPWESTSIRGDFFFRPEPGQPGYSQIVAVPPIEPAVPSRFPTLAVTVGAVSLVALAVGTVAGIYAKTAYDLAESRCPTHQDCDTKTREHWGDAQFRADTSTIAMAAGAVGLATATYLLFDFLDENDDTNGSIAVLPSPTGLGFYYRRKL